MEKTEPRPPIYPAEWLEESPPSVPVSLRADLALQDGMRVHFEAQPTDWKTKKASETQPFDYRDFLSRWARHLGGLK